MKRLEVKLVGLTPLLQHAFSNGNEIELPGASGRKKTRSVSAADEPTPREAAEKAAYRNARGEFYFPSTCLLRLAREAAANHKIRGTRKSAKYLVPSALFPVGEEVVITNGDGVTPVADFEVDSRPVVIPSTKGRVMRHRPRWDTWSATALLDLDDELIAPSFVQLLLEEGGRRVGIGDYRPEKGGPYGRFRVVSFREV
jgi:hypothetical protein